MGINPIGQVISLWAHLLFMYGMCVLVISILLYVDLVTDEIDLKNKGSVKSMMLFIIVGSILSLISNSALVATRKPTITITAGISAVLSFVIMAIASFIYDGIASSKNLNYKDSVLSLIVVNLIFIVFQYTTYYMHNQSLTNTIGAAIL